MCIVAFIFASVDDCLEAFGVVRVHDYSHLVEV